MLAAWVKVTDAQVRACYVGTSPRGMFSARRTSDATARFHCGAWERSRVAGGGAGAAAGDAGGRISSQRLARTFCASPNDGVGELIFLPRHTVWRSPKFLASPGYWLNFEVELFCLSITTDDSRRFETVLSACCAAGVSRQANHVVEKQRFGMGLRLSREGSHCAHGPHLLEGCRRDFGLARWLKPRSPPSGRCRRI